MSDKVNPFVETTRVEGLEEATVESLKSKVRDQWDIDILYDFFNVKDRNLILKIPLSKRIKSDNWFWLWD